MRVCFLAGTLGRGGAERQLIYMLRALLAADFAPRVLCLTSGEAFEAEIKALNVPLEWVGESQRKPLRLAKIIGSLQKQPTDVLQSAHFYTNLYAAAAGRFLKIKNIGAIRSDLTNELRANKWLGRWQLRAPQHLIVNSQAAFQKAVAAGISAEKIDLVRNAVEGCGAATAARGANKLRIVFVGRLVALKRADAFVRLAARLREKTETKVQFQIVGDGEQKPQLERLAADCGLSPNDLEFAGARQNMCEIYSRADVLVSTSAYEGTPNVILEAMFYGVPVIATNVGGTPEILDDTRGILIDGANPEEQLLDAALRLVNDAKLRKELGRAGRNYVHAHHSLDYLQNRLIEIYNKIC